MIKPKAKHGAIRRFFYKTPNPKSIVPEGGVAGKALSVVIAIMTFLASLSLGGVDLVQRSAQNWQTQISSEATIQVRPTDGVDMEKTLQDAVRLVQGFHGILSARIIDRAATERLLEPWLGSGLTFDDLPIPRLIVVTLDQNNKADFSLIKDAVNRQIPGGSFNDHRNWIDRLVSMAQATVVIGLIIVFLVLSALILTIVFATRGALSGNAHIVEVLHFIGAEARFVARQFDLHFLTTGLRGAIYGGFSAIVFFGIFSLWTSWNMGSPEADQASALFGSFSISWTSYAIILGLIIFVSLLTMITSRLTILSQLKAIDRRESDLF